MKLKPYYLGLVLLILLGLTASSAFGVGSAGTITGGTFPACVDPATANASTIKIAGKQVAPGGLVRVPTGTTCLASETTLNLNSYLKTILVSPGPTNITSGTNLQNAMTAATPGTLIKVEPGTYDLGTTSLTMKQNVDLEGSGEGLTNITSQIGSASSPPTAGTVVLASSSEIRFLSVSNNSKSDYNTAVYASGVNKTARLSNVTVKCTGGVENNGIFNDNSASPTIQNSTISAAGGSKGSIGISSTNSSSPTIQNSTISTTGGKNYNFGIYNGASFATIQNSTISAAEGIKYNYGLYNINSSSLIQNSNISAAGGSFDSIGIYNLANSSPTIQNSTISAAAGNNFNYGILNGISSSPTIQNLTISATGGIYTFGINNSNSSPTIQNSNISATGGTYFNYGIYNDNSATPTIQDSTIFAARGNNGNYGLYNFGDGNSAKVGASQLMTAVSGTGFTCVGVYDANFAALSPTCT